MAHITALRCCPPTVQSSLKANATITTSLFSASRKTAPTSTIRPIHTQPNSLTSQSSTVSRSGKKSLNGLHTSKANSIAPAWPSEARATKDHFEHVVIGSRLETKNGSETAWATISGTTTITAAAAMRRTILGRDKTSSDLCSKGIDLKRAFTLQCQHNNQCQHYARSSNSNASTRLRRADGGVSVEEGVAGWDRSATGLRREGWTLFEPSRGRTGWVGGAMGQQLTRR